MITCISSKLQLNLSNINLISLVKSLKDFHKLTKTKQLHCKAFTLKSNCYLLILIIFTSFILIKNKNNDYYLQNIVLVL